MSDGRLHTCNTAAADIRVVRVGAGQTDHLPPQCPRQWAVTTPSGLTQFVLQVEVGGVTCPASPSGALRNQGCLDELAVADEADKRLSLLKTKLCD